MKPYTWQEIRGVLEGELATTSAIMTFGTIGSLNVDHDIDIIVTKKPQMSTAVFYKELHAVLSSVDEYLSTTYGAKLIRFTASSHQDEVLILGQYGKQDLAFHVMAYVSGKSMEEDWLRALTPSDSLDDILKNHYTVIFGDKTALSGAEFVKRKTFDNMMLYLDYFDRFNAHFPESMLVQIINHLCHYVAKNISAETLIATTEREARQNFYTLADLIDKKNEEMKL